MSNPNGGRDRYKGDRVKFTLRIDVALMAHLWAIAEAEDTDMNTMICQWLAAMVQVDDSSCLADIACEGPAQ